MVWHHPHPSLSDSEAGKRTHLLSSFIIAEGWANLHQESSVPAKPGEAGRQRSLAPAATGERFRP